LNLPYIIEHFAVAICATSGVLAARGKRLDLFGVVVLALATALGGGTLRDLCLGIQPVFWIKDPNYVLTAAVSAVLTFVIARFKSLPEKFLQVADAFGLALFTVVGMEIALRQQSPGLIAVLMGVMTGVAGGIVRDVLSGEIPMVFRPQIFLYATASLCGAALFLLLDRIWPGTTSNRFIAMTVILGLRLAAIQWRIVLPVFKHRDDPHDHREEG